MILIQDGRKVHPSIVRVDSGIISPTKSFIRQPKGIMRQFTNLPDGSGLTEGFFSGLSLPTLEDSILEATGGLGTFF